MRKYLVAIIVLFSISCSNQNKLKDGFRYVHLVADSLKTEADFHLIKKLHDIQYSYLKAKDNKIVLDITKKEFVSKGVPVEYYDLFISDIKEGNKLLKEYDNVDIESLLKDMRESLIKR